MREREREKQGESAMVANDAFRPR